MAMPGFGVAEISPWQESGGEFRSDTMQDPILVTGAAGRLGGVGRTIVEILRQRNLPVRTLVRREDRRADALRAIGAEIAVGDLTRAADVAHALEGCRRMFFGMSVSASYLEATVTAAAAARAHGNLEAFVNSNRLPARCPTSL
jgi:NAD(P)H dehydrogenase (quinone)